MKGNRQLPPNLKIMQLYTSFANTGVVCTLVKSGVMEHLRDSTKTLGQIASAGKYNPDVLFRILRYAEAIELVSLSGDRYSITETGKLLLKDVPGSLSVGAMLFGSEPWQKSWRNLSYSLETGSPAFENALGKPFFEFLNQNPLYGDPFDKWMTISTTIVSKAIVEAYDFAPYKTICDIGGGQGILLKYILESNPHLKGILYDQESVVSNNLLSDLSSRVEIRSGNFFESVPSADVLIMKYILHDWDDKKSLQILNACRKQMNSNNKLLILEMIIDKASDLIGLFFDLHMQIITAGRERTENEFRQLLGSGGLKLNRIIPTRSPMKIIEAVL